jgi:putative Mn2+ efflux pump MntP
MIHEAQKASAEADEEARAPAAPNAFGLKLLALLAIATSIDALAAGVALALTNVSIAWACAVIGVVTAVLSFCGVLAGHRFGAWMGKRLEIVGGVVLLGLAVKSLVDHYVGR